MTFALGFKTKVDSLTYMLCCLYTTDFSDSPLVRHLLTSLAASMAAELFHPDSCVHALVGLESRN